MQTSSIAQTVVLHFEPQFKELPVGDVVFYKVSLTNQSNVPITIQRPSVGRNVNIELVALLSLEARGFESKTELRQVGEKPSSVDHDKWTLKPEETKSEILLVNLWADSGVAWANRLDDPEDKYVAYVNTQPIGDYSDYVIEFTPFAQSFETSTAVVDSREKLSRLVNDWIRPNGEELNHCLFDGDSKWRAKIIDYLVAQPVQSRFQLHARIHLQIQTWLDEGLPVATVLEKSESLVNETDAELQEWYRQRIKEEIQLLTSPEE